MVLYQAKESSATHAGYGLFSAKNNLIESRKATFLNPSEFRFAGERIAKCINSFFISGVPGSNFPLFYGLITVFDYPLRGWGPSDRVLVHF